MAISEGLAPIDICALCGVSLEDHPEGLLCSVPDDKEEDIIEPRHRGPKPIHKNRGMKIYIKED